MITSPDFTVEASVGSASPSNVAIALFGSIRALARRIALWASTCAENRAAAALYERLSALSDTELRNRELSRDTLARDLSWTWREFT